jgi:Vitamin B12 dependent methionine synthase, activation domain
VNQAIPLAFGDVAPPRDAVLARIGIPPGTVLADRIERIIDRAADALAASVAPVGLLADVSREAFLDMYHGGEHNAAESPVAAIAPKAEHLALFAVTLGHPTSAAVAEWFTGADFALAYVLDAMASVAADTAAEAAERWYGRALREGGWSTPDAAVLRYSPGYCGWDVTGQRALFAYLKPERIGLTLSDSCLMQPLKSVSGVLLAGPRAIHRFPPTFDFCGHCEERTCRDRLAALASAARD